MTKDEILSEGRIYCSLTNDLTQSWKMVLDWRHISQASLSRRIGISERTISLIVQGKRKGEVETIVLMCLGANLPYLISSHIMSLSGINLVPSREDHCIFLHLLQTHYKDSIPSIRDYLLEIGSDLYMIFPVKDEMH